MLYCIVYYGGLNRVCSLYGCGVGWREGRVVEEVCSFLGRCCFYYIVLFFGDIINFVVEVMGRFGEFFMRFLKNYY